jgi:multiple sugar transport system ATP-binding protein
MTLSDRVAVMLDGELLQVGPPQEIYADPANRKVAEFIGSPRINMIESRGSGVVLGIRPEAFTLTTSDKEAVLSGEVRLVEHLGSDVYLHLDRPGQAEPVIARLDAERAAHISLGQTIHLAVRPEKILLFGPDGQRLRADVMPLRAYAQ